MLISTFTIFYDLKFKLNTIFYSSKYSANYFRINLKGGSFRRAIFILILLQMKIWSLALVPTLHQRRSFTQLIKLANLILVWIWIVKDSPFIHYKSSTFCLTYLFRIKRYFLRMSFGFAIFYYVLVDLICLILYSLITGSGIQDGNFESSSELNL